MSHRVPAELEARWRAQGLLDDGSLAEVFQTAVRDRPEAALTVISESRPSVTTLKDFDDQARRVAAGFRSIGLGAGDVVAVQTPNWLETALAHTAISLIRGVILPVVHIYGPAELTYILRQSGARAVITPDLQRGIDYIARTGQAMAGLESVAHIVVGEAPAGAIDWSQLATCSPMASVAVVDPDSVAMLIYTSGTTSNPKGVQHSHRTLLSELRSTPETDPAEVSLSPWPPGHIAGALALARFWLMGRNTVLMERWDAEEAAGLIAKHRIRSTAGTPFHLTSLLDAAEANGDDISSLTDYLAGATMIPPSLVARCQARGLNTYRAYGMSEHPTISRGAASDPFEKRMHSDGRLCPGVEVMIVDDDGQPLPVGLAGEILSRGPDRFLGYRDPALNAGVILSGGWLATGDIGKLDEDGFLSITDRKKDLIIRGGENIASREVEDILATLPGVREAAVVGAPHPSLGEQVCAFLVTMPDADVSLATIDAHFRAWGVARQKTPERIVLIDDLPRNAAGKVLKPALRAMLPEQPAD